ncbi:sentrin-specific protease 5-like [Vitis riparia]|uniref:sentrin-specific protease 5-like n=1 Tax=Vitis riparia TaxID=96939 RepID=UPI00155A67B0|nr:sentrin-specific protease 5-like [Vitis riparia]
MDLKVVAAIVFDGALDPSEELVALHDTSLSRGNLTSFQGDSWIGNHVVDAYCRVLQFDDASRTKLYLWPYIAEMVMRSNGKHLMREGVIGRYERYLFPIDVSYQNVNEVYLPVLLKNHWSLYVYDIHNKRIQLLDSRPGRRRSSMNGIQQNLAKVVLWLVAYKKQMVDVDFKMFRFVMPDVPSQPNDNDCGVFVMKFMENWSNGGLSKSVDVGKINKYRLKILGRLLLSAHNAHRHRFLVD